MLPAGPYLRLSATAVTLTIAGQSVTGLAVDVERTVVDGAAVTRVTISGGTIELSTGATVVVRLTGVNGSLVLGATGLAGRLSATVALAVPGRHRRHRLGGGQHLGRRGARPAGRPVPAGRDRRARPSRSPARPCAPTSPWSGRPTTAASRSSW